MGKAVGSLEREWRDESGQMQQSGEEPRKGSRPEQRTVVG